MAPGSGRALINMVVLKSLGCDQVTAIGNPGVSRAYAYLPDMTRAAVGLAETRADLPAYADIPFAGDTFSVSDLARDLERLSGRKLKIARCNWLVMRLTAPFWELAREYLQMRYLYELPHTLDPTPSHALLSDLRHTSRDSNLRDHLPVAQGAATSTQTGR